MRQVLIIHGGNSFNTYKSYRQYLEEKEINYDKLLSRTSWKQWLTDELQGCEVLMPSMPNSLNAVYDEWRVYFEKFLPHLRHDVHLVGHSLGGMFLAKYLNDHRLEKPVEQVIFVAPGYDDDSNEELGSFRVDSAQGVAANTKQVHLFHSVDDPVVPFTELEKFRRDLPKALVHTFKDRGHFFDVTPTFPELLDLLKQK